MTSDPRVPPNQPPRSTPAASAEPAASATPPPVPAAPHKSAVRFTRTAAAWWALAVGLLILIILLIFIAQNTDSITIHFLGWRWSSPLGVAFLLSAVSGALIIVLAGTARMVQLHLAAKKNLQFARRPADPAP
ncbi:MAG: DUF1049 domain-containing protein [Mycobacteriaceae bacterium]|nr:DUF1049 domain-containing protein [Mycobacteriaceae bacterium]